MTMITASLSLLFAIAMTDQDIFIELNHDQPLMRIEQQQTTPPRSSKNREKPDIRQPDCSIEQGKCVRQLLYTPPRNPFPVVLF